MKVLISPTSLAEANFAFRGGADIIDIKNTKEGSLGANFPWVIKSIVDAFKGEDITFSATLGDLPYKPGTAALAALGACVSGATYIKAGLKDIEGYQQGVDMMTGVYKTCKDYNKDIIVVASGYADYKRFGGLDSQTLVKVATATQCEVVMVDTAIKDGKTLFDGMGEQELADFIGAAHENNLLVALAGSIGAQHIDFLAKLKPDIIGVRGAVCDKSNRNTPIKEELVQEFMKAVQTATILQKS